MRRSTLAACFGLLVLCVYGVSHAAITATAATSAMVTYTADNMVNAWWLIEPSVTTLLPPGANSSDWRKADSYALSGLEVGSQYQIVWEVQNGWSLQYPPGGNNPAGFLAQIALDGQAPILSSSSWEFAPYTFSGAPFSSLSWTAASAYGANSGPTTWSSASGGPIAGIDESAQWIWSADNIGEPHGFVRATFTAPVPLPAAAWMLGAGLVGLVAVRRRGR